MTALNSTLNRTIASDLNFLHPEFRRMAKEQWGDQWVTLYDFFKAMGNDVAVSNETYGHWEGNLIHQSATVRTVKASASANNAAATIDVTSSSDKVYIRIGDSVEFINGVKGRVTAVTRVGANNWNATVIPTTLDEAIPALALNERIMIYSNSFGEGTGQPASRYRDFDYVSNTLQILKETLTGTGTARTDKIWFNVPGSKDTFFHVNQLDVERRLKLYISNALVNETQITNTAAQTDDGNTVTRTQGMLDFARSRGTIVTKAAGAFAVTDFDTLEANAVRARAPQTLLMLNGLDRAQEIDSKLTTEFQDSNIAQVQRSINGNYFKEGESLEALMTYKQLKKNKCTFILGNMDAFDHPEMYAATGFASKYGNTALVVPFGKTKDPKTGKLSPYMGFAYKSYAGYNRAMEVWDYGSAKPVNKIGDIDTDNIFARAHVGFWGSLGNHWQIIQP